MNYLMICFLSVLGRFDTAWHSPYRFPVMSGGGRQGGKKLAEAGRILPKCFLGGKELGSYEAALLKRAGL